MSRRSRYTTKREGGWSYVQDSPVPKPDETSEYPEIMESLNGVCVIHELFVNDLFIQLVLTKWFSKRTPVLGMVKETNLGKDLTTHSFIYLVTPSFGKQKKIERLLTGL